MTLWPWLMAGCLLPVFYTYLGYPLLVRALAVLTPNPVWRAPIEPTLSLLIIAHNEAAALRGKLENTLAIDYPAERLEILVASDGSTDRTEEIAQSFADRGVRVVAGTERRGKTAATNHAVLATRGEILVFSDATGLYEPGALRALVANFADESVGAVGGRVSYSAEQSQSALGFSAYQRYEVAQRRAEGAFGSETSVSGSISALRRELFQPAAEELSFDLFLPLLAADAGLRTVYEFDAVSHELTRASFAAEFRCRVRLAIRAYSHLAYFLRRDERCADRRFIFQFISHKVLRWLSPIFLVGFAVSSLAAATAGGIWAWPAWAMGALLTAAAVGWLTRDRTRGSHFLGVPLFVVGTHVAFLVGLARYLAGTRVTNWSPER